TAPLIEAEPMELADAIEFFEHTIPESQEKRWKPFLAELRGTPGGPLAKALSTPLMVWLVRSVYEGTDADPAELVNRKVFATEADVEGHLLNALIPALIGLAKRRPKDGPRSVRNWDSQDAQRWLTFVAKHMERVGTPDLAWWELVPGRRWRIPLGTMLWLVYGVAIGIVWNSLWVGLAVAALWVVTWLVVSGGGVAR